MVGSSLSEKSRSPKVRLLDDIGYLLLVAASEVQKGSLFHFLKARSVSDTAGALASGYSSATTDSAEVTLATREEKSVTFCETDS